MKIVNEQCGETFEYNKWIHVIEMIIILLDIHVKQFLKPQLHEIKSLIQS